VESEELSRSMPRATRSGGPPQSAAVVNPTKKSSKKKKKARKTGTTQQPGPTSARANDDATEDAADARYPQLVRLAKDLRDAAADHPLAQGPLLDFLTKNWKPQGADEVQFPSTPKNVNLSDSHEEHDEIVEASKFSAAEQIVNQAIQFLVNIRSGLPAKLPVGLSPSATFVFSAMQHALVNAPYGFRGLLASLESLQTFLSQLFDESKKGRNAYREAQCYLTDMYNDFKVTLRLASDRLGGEHPVETLYNEWSDEVRSADLSFFDPLELLQSAVKRVTVSQSNRLVKLHVAASAQRAFASSTGTASPAGGGHVPARIPPPPGLGFPVSGKRYFRLLGKTGRFPTNRDACVLCGKGELPGTEAHRAEACKATDAEIENWVEHAIPAK